VDVLELFNLLFQAGIRGRQFAVFLLIFLDEAWNFFSHFFSIGINILLNNLK
jgi:hypothetical protein